MNINKALEHFEWKLSNHWKPTQKDIEAYNAIIDYKEMQQSINMSQNENLAKLWIHQLILLNETQMYSAERSIQVIDEILEHSVYTWTLRLKDRLNIMRFNAVLNKNDNALPKDFLNRTELKENGLKSIKGKEAELTKALTSETKEKDVIKFVEIQVNRIINKFEK